jgi:hydroxymethylbilane synthase
MAKVEGGLPKGLFTKELEVALEEGQADIAVHSLKDLPTELPTGLVLAATPERADVRDVLIYCDADFLKNKKLETRNSKPTDRAALKGLKPHTTLKNLPKSATVATSSTRRKAQLLIARPDLKVVEIRGNVPTRLQKVADGAELDATVLALAGISRLNFTISADGKLHGNAIPDGLLASILELDEMLPAAGQGAIGIEIRADDERIVKICERLNHFDTFQCVTAERAFLAGMGGGCQSPVAAYGEILNDKIFVRAISFANGPMRRAEGKRPIKEAAQLGQQLAAELK